MRRQLVAIVVPLSLHTMSLAGSGAQLLKIPAQIMQAANGSLRGLPTRPSSDGSTETDVSNANESVISRKAENIQSTCFHTERKQARGIK